MSNDYELLDRELKAYHKGFEEGFRNGALGGQIEGIDYLISVLMSMRQELLGGDEEKPNAEDNT